MKKLIFIYFGLLAILGAVYFPLSQVQPVESMITAPRPESIIPTIKPVISGKPVRIQIPSVGIDISVVDGTYNPANQTWSLSKNNAQYAATTPLINDTAGNTFIYGHNNRYVFNNLIAIKPGERVTITTVDGKRFNYVFRDSLDVKPHQVEAIKYTGSPMLTVQTCVGQYFEQRRMFRFDYISYES